MADESERKYGPKEAKELHAMEKRTGSEEITEASEAERGANAGREKRVQGGQRRSTGPPSRMEQGEP